MNKIFFLGLAIILFQTSITKAQSKNSIVVRGNIIEINSHQPIEYATIRLYSNQDKLLTGTISDKEGNFKLLCTTEEFYLKIDFIGFSPKILREYSIANNQVTFNDIELEIDRKTLKEVVIRGEKSQIEFKTDKRVFNVGQDLISAGGSALDVLNNVPSVDVNIEGTVSLRGNANVLILINGKPSVITEGNSLGTITADMIDKVEVITNPSAKYDAEGTSGILNIIMKKDEEKGTNGSISLNTGYPHNHSLGLSLNRRTKNFNLFSQFGAGYRRFKSKTTSHSLDKSMLNPIDFYTDGSGNKNEQFYNIILGTDYHINALNVLTITGNFGYEIEDEDALFVYKGLNSSNTIVSNIERTDITEGINPKMEYQLNYDKSFADNEKRKLTASVTGSYFGKDKSSDFVNQVLKGEGENLKQKASNNFSDASYNFSMDYTHPFSEKSTLETGAKYIMEKLTNDYTLSDWQNEQWVDAAAYTNKFDYDQNTAALYSTYEHEIEKIGFKAGLRLENTQVNTLLHNNDEKNKQNYTDLFPSIHTTYKLTKKLSFQLGYSRRISRPRLWDVNPFFSFRDAYNLQTGNPDLKPEYTDAFELTSVKIFSKASLSGSVFHRRTTDVMSDVVKLENNVAIGTLENIGNSYNTGLELNSKVEPLKWLAVMLDAYYSYYVREGNYQEENFDFNSNTYSGRLTTKIKLPLNFDMELRGRHRSDYKDLQSTHKAESTMDMGIRKKVLAGRGVIHLSVNDVFDSHKHKEITDLPSFYRSYERSRDGRRIILGLSFGFGKGEAMEFSGQKMF